MKKNDRHEPYCGCASCKRPERELPLLQESERKGGVEPNIASPVPSGTPRAERDVSLLQR